MPNISSTRGGKLFFLLLFLLCTSAGAFAQNHKLQQKYFPKPFKKLFFGMSLEEFAKVRKKLPSDKLVHEEFRYRWLETFGRKSPIAAAVYYFGEKEEKPLYEIVIFYRDLQARTKFQEKVFGPPNHNKVEWKFSSAEGFVLRAWNYEERMVIVGAISGTEWEME